VQRVSKIAKEVLLQYSIDNIAYGDLDLLHEVFDKAKIKIKIQHPLNKCAAVLNALDRESKRKDAIFIKEYFRSFKGLARMFTLNPKESEDV